ncbi:MAG: hypothetical protein ACOVOV_20470, partial [Dolichospermum sp.]
GGSITSNTAIGYNALINNGPTGANNTAVGYQVLTNNSTGTYNTAVGYQALTTNSTGANNTAVGTSSLNFNTSGGSNSALGLQSLYYNTSGGSNTAIGYQSGLGNTGASYNTYLGSLANTSGNYSYSTALGYNSRITADNQIMLGGLNGSVYPQVVAPGGLTGSTGSFNNLTVSGNVGIGKSNPSCSLDVSGNANITGTTTFNGVSVFKSTAELTSTDLRLSDASNNFTQMYQSGLYASITQGFTGGTIGFYTKDPSNSIIDPSINNIANLTLSTTNGSVLKSKYGQNFTVTYDSNYPPTSPGGNPFVISGAGSYGGQFLFIPYAQQGSYNNMPNTSDCVIIAQGGTTGAYNNSALTLTAWSNTTNGLRITSTSTMLGAGGTGNLPSTYIQSDGSSNTIVGQT